ncbi:related to GPI transamidase component S (phosphatidyl inositol glycan class S) [Cephalotrichum gorgonifer]|uniref:Related to GPI transamidase component S (Phosphatidyl inositol glycan class S) n=1 Tax=Cephalotrichum gorgonifer TaxID=2041049 RepID=A0AAE8N4B5_9PEZI|nr:related to GPI transamidase component S (phosphatidyl inositol glycan class S) [Cephalotrichum gorgonifer]
MASLEGPGAPPVKAAQDDAPPSPPQAPPEKPSDKRRRSLIILSSWIIVVLLGLPIWWKTTSIYRANLPLSEMIDWADGKACKPSFSLQVALDAGGLPDEAAQTLLRLTQGALDDLNDFPAHQLRLRLPPDSSADGTAPQDALTVRLTPGDSMSATLDSRLPVLSVAYPPDSIPPPTSSASALATYVASELHAAFSEEQAILSYLLSSSTMAPESSKKTRTTRAFRYSHTYHLTFSLFTSGPAPSTWDIDAAIASYMQPVLDVLSLIHNFTVDTQVQLYAAPGVQSEDLSKDDLTSFINAAEWPLSPSIGGAPTINFIIYMGNQTVALSESEKSQSWLIPQWGAVYLLPPTPGSHVSPDALKKPLLAFSSHLLSLLGTPEKGSLPLRLSALARIRSADLLIRASSTLGALARLSLSLPSISIPGSVADGVAKSLRHLSIACADLASPQALEHARIAEAEAERAFFEKSMVGQLYFPDEHKVAVYMPLLGPVGVPLVTGLVREIREWLKRRKERAAVAKEKKET